MLPVNVISGFLGVGKTSLLLDCLTYLEGKQDVAIIENEIGNVNIDAARLRKKNQHVYEISNGCMCCSQQEELNLILNQLAKIKTLDRILIEPSGVFIIETLLEVFNHPRISKRFYIESISVVVDAISFSDIAHLPFVRQQIKMANIIVINKTDKSKQINAVIGLVKQINPQSIILLRANTLKDIDVEKLFVPQIVECSSKGMVAHQFKTQQLNDNRFATIRELERYLLNKSDGLLRAKGRVQIQKKSFEVSYTLSEFKYWQVPEDRPSENKLVLIYR